MAKYPTTTRDWYADPFAELENLQREMNRLFNTSLFKQADGETSLLGGQWSPAIDMYDAKDNVVIKADLPGLKKEDIEVSVQDNVLTIKGEKKRSSEAKEDDYLRTERFFGTFYRSITLPTEVDRDRIQAKFKDGVLELVLPKKEEVKPKQIQIDIA